MFSLLVTVMVGFAMNRWTPNGWRSRRTTKQSAFITPPSIVDHIEACEETDCLETLNALLQADLRQPARLPTCKRDEKLCRSEIRGEVVTICEPKTAAATSTTPATTITASTITMAPLTPCDVNNGGCQQECSFMDDEVNCTCFDNYEPVGNGSVCDLSSIFGGATAVITDSMSLSSNYTVCGYSLPFLSDTPILAIISSDGDPILTAVLNTTDVLSLHLSTTGNEDMERTLLLIDSSGFIYCFVLSGNAVDFFVDLPGPGRNFTLVASFDGVTYPDLSAGQNVTIGGEGRFDAQVFWAGFWTRSLTVPEMNRIDCNPGDADIGYDGFELVGVIEETVSCDDFETNF